MSRQRQTVIIALDTLIEHAETRPAKLRRARALILEALSDSTVPASAPVAQAKARRGAVAPGSVGDRIIQLITAAGKPVAKRDLVGKVGALELDVMLTVKELIADGRLIKKGERAGTTYQLAKGGAK